MNKARVTELEMIAHNEIKYRGQAAGWNTLKNSYALYELDDREAKIVAHLVQNAEVTLPNIPIEFLYDD